MGGGEGEEKKIYLREKASDFLIYIKRRRTANVQI